ncbi:unnamed protein product [Oppiella nova]|uniref:Uncharacterized protein n=1 Tax=Oppiella nova TaxID=334625 RepID=A0A7R9M3Y5_9ACAR|nr:unnamed protein product [Oppiella nova]CAG2170120.1 unnamed protein product [Oppiella nova]
MNKETQTLELSISEVKPKKEESVTERKIVEQRDAFTQTDNSFEIQTERLVIESNSTKSLCENCTKVMKIVYTLKNCVEKLEENIKSSETKFVQRLQLLQTENNNLTESMNKRLNEKDLQLIEKEEQINYMQNRITNNQLVPSMPPMPGEESSVSEEQILIKTYNKTKPRYEAPPQLSSSCRNVLESVINCLQARLEHKDESIRQYRNMLSETKQNFENEMIRLIEANRESDDKNSINFTQMIDNEELQSALKSCVNELELCKTELNSKINDLEEELERKNAKLKAFQSENEELKTKRMNPNTQLKQTVEDLKEESQQKDLLISTLKKSIKDDRAMRAVSAVRRPKEDDIKRDKKVDNQLFQEIADLRAMTETQKNTIKHLEVVKWDYEKNLKELKEQMKQKAKEKEMEISELKEKIDKIKVRMNRNENEKQLLQNKVTLREKTQKNRQQKWTQTTGAVSEQDVNKLKQEMKTLRHELKERENESNVLRKSLEMSGQKESELKTLLEESVKREKLATIHEKNVECDQQYDHLLEENARIKVELRMAEFELNRRSQTLS